MSAALAQITHIARERAATEAAINREADETLAALRNACGGSLPDPLAFTHEHVRALIRSAFLAGVVHQCERAKLQAETV